MKVYVKFFDGDVTIDDAESTTTDDGYFLVLDEEGDNLFVSRECNIKYVRYDYAN